MEENAYLPPIENLVATAVSLFILIAASYVLKKTWDILQNNQKDSHPPIKEEFPIDFPMEPVFHNYISILEDIRNCQNDHELKTCWVRCTLFNCCYKDEELFVTLSCDLKMKYDKLALIITKQHHGN